MTTQLHYLSDGSVDMKSTLAGAATNDVAWGKQYDAEQAAKQAAKEATDNHSFSGLFTHAPPVGDHVTRLQIQQALHKAADHHGRQMTHAFGDLYDAITIFASDDQERLEGPLNQAIARLCVVAPGAARAVSHVSSDLRYGHSDKSGDVRILDVRSALHETQGAFLHALDTAAHDLPNAYLNFAAGMLSVIELDHEIRYSVPSHAGATVLCCVAEMLKDAQPAISRLLVEHGVHSTAELPPEGPTA